MKRETDKEKQTRHRLHDLLRQGTEALHRGEITRAIRLLERAHRLDPANVDVALNLGGALILAQAFTRAVSILEPLSERDPHNPMVWTNLGAAYLGNPVLATDYHQERAIAAFERAIQLNPATPNVAYNLGLVHRDRDEVERALYWFERALETDPNDRDARSHVEKLTHDADPGAAGAS
jgi:tetratricopeptide (TPR) repeat protein